MGHYLSITEEQRAQMLEAIGLSSVEELYSAVPSELVLKNGLDLPSGLSELEVLREMTALYAAFTSGQPSRSKASDTSPSGSRRGWTRATISVVSDCACGDHQELSRSAGRPSPNRTCGRMCSLLCQAS